MVALFADSARDIAERWFDVKRQGDLAVSHREMVFLFTSSFSASVLCVRCLRTFIRRFKGSSRNGRGARGI